jgi:DNA-binding MarR family transcriptional regulator
MTPGETSPKRRQSGAGAGERTTRSLEIGEALSRLAAASVRRGQRDISLTSLSTLATLERTGPRRITDLAFVEGVTQPAMTSLVNALERAELVERAHDPSDKRVALIALTRAGAGVLRTKRRAGSKAVAHLIDKLSPAEVQALANALPALLRVRELAEEERESSSR